MSIISEKYTNFTIDKYIFELNQAYFLTYSYSLSPNYLKQPFITITFSYDTNDLFQFINNLYIIFFSEKTTTFEKISINGLSVIENSVELEMNYYYPKKKGKIIDYKLYVEAFLNKLDDEMRNLFELNSRQYVLSTMKLTDINKDNILNNFARLEGNLEKSYYLEENSMEFLINYLSNKFNPDYINFGFYTFQLKTYSALVLYIQNPDKIISNFLESIFKNAFYSSKNILSYEPLVFLKAQEENNEVILAIYQRLLLNNMNIKMRILDFDNDKLVFIEKISKNKIKLKNLIVELVTNLYSRENDETPYSLVFPDYIEKYQAQLAEIYLKNNKKFILENFYLPQFKTSELPYVPYVSFDSSKNIINYKKLVYIPILHIGKLNEQVEKEWKVLQTQWINYIYNFYYNGDIVILRNIIINLKEFRLKTKEPIPENIFYYILVSSLEHLGVNYKTIKQVENTFVVEDIEINSYDILLEKQTELSKMILIAIKNNIETIIIPENNFINKLRELSPIYSWILKKKLKEINKNFVDFIILEKDLVLLGFNLKTSITNELKNFLGNALIEIEEKESSRCNRIINSRIEYDTLITIKDKCYTIDTLLELLETNYIKKYSREGQLIIKKLKELIPDYILSKFKTFKEDYILSNVYKLSLKSNNEYFIVSLINRLTNEELQLFVMPNKVNLVNKLYDLWRNDNLLSNITYKFAEELNDIPRDLVKLKIPLEDINKLTFSEQINYFNSYFSMFL
jgi:hypothetical protein